MLGRRLEYQSLKSVLLQMDANVRFQISLHMPSIKSVEKVVPLKVKSLRMTHCTTKVNDTEYAVSVHRQYPNAGKIPWELVDGSGYDYDEFGFHFVSGVGVLLPGDVSFQEVDKDDADDGHTEEDERMCRKDLSDLEKALEMLNRLQSTGSTVQEYLESLENVPYENDEDQRVRNVLRADYWNIAKRVERLKHKLLPFECRRNNTKRSFDCYIQMSTSEQAKIEHIQRFEYNRKLFEAAKCLNEVLFGDRTMPIRVGELSLGANDIFRLPVGFRLQIQKTSCGYSRITHKSFPLMVENAESLNCLEVDDWELHHNGYKCQIVRNARRLVINRDTESLFEMIQSLPNREICILQRDQASLPEFYLTMFQAWLYHRQVGASLWIKTAYGGEKMANDVMRLMKIYNAEINFTESFIWNFSGTSISTCIIFPLSNSTSLEIRSVPFRDSSWMLKGKILSV